MGERDDNATEPLPAPAEHLPQHGERAWPSLVGRTLGKFTVLEPLGRGGSGEVFRAEQPQLNRSAVIKVLRRDLAGAPNRVDRFLREARLASRLDHPYAAHIYAFGAEPDGILWIAMEYVRGATLDELVLRRGPMPPSLFGPLFARLCEVVHSAHELGIVHRDIKGSNVMVIERAGQLLPKLLDFGIAKGIEAEPAVERGTAPAREEVELTAQGATLGSPHYMAPEQWEAPGEVDARADIYALGVLAFRCITGKLPFQDVPRAGLAHAHLTQPVPGLGAGVALPIADVVRRALAKQPEARWASALAFGEAMRRAVGGRAPEALPELDAETRDAWFRGGPQPIADAMGRLARATTTVEADAALRELVAITCRWLAVLALASLGADERSPEVSEHVHAVIGRDDAAPWLRLARAASRSPANAPGGVDAPARVPLPGLAAALADTAALEALAERLDDRDRPRTAEGLAFDIAALPEALRPLEVLLAYTLVVGRTGAAESWQGVRRRDRERVLVWGELADGTVALLDGTNRVVSTLSPLVQVSAPLPSSEPELFLLWRAARGHARLVAAPWGFELDDDAAARRLASLTTEDSDTLLDTHADRSPYPGLAAYGLADASHFVGREREVEALANRLVRSSLLAVLGPSGAGKSSFLHAGLVPRLAEQYEIVTLRPGRHPLAALAAAVGVPEAEACEARLHALGERAPRGLVLVIDQLEELVTLCHDAGERRRFAELLARVTASPAAPVRAIVTLRDDFATVLEHEDALHGRFDVFVLATPAPEALRRIVVEPARRAQVSVDARVVDDMVAEVAGRPASLPLLSFTAAQLWEARDRAARRITYDAYLALGGVAGALSTYADQIYNSLARRDQDTVRDLFARLVAPDGTRIPAPRAELEQLPDARTVLAHLVDARLLVARDDDGGGDLVEIVHECLAERWPRLARWRSEDAADRALLGDVTLAARRWHDAGRRADLLWRGEALGELRRLAARSTALTELERAFADDATRAEQRSRRLRRALVGAALVTFAGVALAMTYLGLTANQNRAAAERSAAAARTAALLAEERLTASLVAQGRRELNDRRAMPALAYFAEALRRGADTPALRLMITLASRAWRFELPTPPGIHALAVVGLAHGAVVGDAGGTLHWFDADGTARGSSDSTVGYLSSFARQTDGRLVAIGRDRVVVIDPATRSVTHALAVTTEPFAARAGPGPGELTLVEDAAITVYDLATGAPRRTLALPARQNLGEPHFSPTGSHVLLSTPTELDAIDLVAMKRRTLTAKPDSPLAASQDGTTRAFVDREGLVHLLAADGTETAAFRPANRPFLLELSPTGDRIAALSDDGLVVHDRAGRVVYGIPSIKSALAIVELRGDELWLGTPDGVVQRYRRGALVASLPTQLGELAGLAVTERLVLTLGNDGHLALVRADAEHVRYQDAPCDTPETGIVGIAAGYKCAGTWHLFTGARPLARLADREMGYAAYHEPSDRSAVAADELLVFERGTRLARSAKLPGLATPAFEDRDHLIVVHPERAPGLWRWTFAEDRWEELATIPKASIVTVAAGGYVVGTQDDAIVLVRDRAIVSRAAVPARPLFITTSDDGAWVAVQLQNGVTVLVDGRTGAVVRELEPIDSIGAAAMLDPAGDLVLRIARGGATIWDRASGEALVWSLDLFQHALAGRFARDGRLELDAWQVGSVELPLDRRPADAILRDIACKVPLRVVDGRLGPARPDCPFSRRGD